MKNYQEWCKEFAWAPTNLDKKLVEAIQADAIESVRDDVGDAIADALQPVLGFRIHIPKPPPPVVHKKCPACGSDAEVVQRTTITGDTVFTIWCERGCMRVGNEYISEKAAWRIWDARVEGAKG